MKNGRIHIAAIKGSMRAGSYTAMALDLVVDEIEKHGDVTVERIDPGTMRLPFPGQEMASSDVEKLQETVLSATGVILSTPEYHGGISSIIKLVIENLGFPSALSGKPVALLGVAGGQIGAIKSLESLRSICAHVGAIVLPGAVSVAGVEALFNDDGECLDPQTERRIRGLGRHLVEYIEKSVCPGATMEAVARSGSSN
ncbi:MAG: NADPH-dependent FMN reductase [Nitrospiria bacterium]